MAFVLEKPSISGLLLDGFNAIKLHTMTNAERGESTDIALLLSILHCRIKRQLGYDYPLSNLKDTYEAWVDAR